MTKEQISSRAKIKLYATPPHPCSYLSDRSAVTVFVDPFFHMDNRVYGYLSRLGFRRSGTHVYRPDCAHCGACLPCRIPVFEFTPNRNQRRVENRNRDLQVRRIPGIDEARHYPLYERYIGARHRDGDMYPADPEQFRSFLAASWSETVSCEFTLDGEPVAVAVTDRMPDGLSAVYTFFAPEMTDRSLGTYAVLWQIAEARRLGLAYTYLGYWIAESGKMDYKKRFRPLEVLRAGRWRPLEVDDGN